MGKSRSVDLTLARYEQVVRHASPPAPTAGISGWNLLPIRPQCWGERTFRWVLKRQWRLWEEGTI